MKIVVCIKQVPSSNQVQVDPITGVLLREGIETKLNPYDLYALETGVQIKKILNSELLVISMGPPQAIESIYESYSLGVDKGVLLSDKKFAGSDVLATSYTLSQGIKTFGDIDIIICGKQTTDGDTAQVGPEIAEYMNIPHVTNVNKIIEMTHDYIIVEADMGDTIEKQKIPYPCLITVEKGIYLPQLPSYKKKLETKDQKIKILSLKDFLDQDESKYGLKGSPTQVERIFNPISMGKKEKLKGENLGKKLYEKLKENKII